MGDGKLFIQVNKINVRFSLIGFRVRGFTVRISNVHINIYEGREWNITERLQQTGWYFDLKMQVSREIE